MDVLKLDHVAVRVSDPERSAAALVARLPVRVLQRTDDLILVGRAPELGKVTFLPGEHAGGSVGILDHVGIRVPAATSTVSVDLLGELPVVLVPGPPRGEVELDHVTLRVPDPVASAGAWGDYELAARMAERDSAAVHVGDAHVELRPSGIGAGSGGLDHIGVRVQSLEEAEELAEERDLDVERVVDAENSRALFVHGPDGVMIELIEHKQSFALA